VAAHSEKARAMSDDGPPPSAVLMNSPIACKSALAPEVGVLPRVLGVLPRVLGVLPRVLGVLPCDQCDEGAQHAPRLSGVLNRVL
jgi:hypothetical protein